MSRALFVMISRTLNSHVRITGRCILFQGVSPVSACLRKDCPYERSPVSGVFFVGTHYIPKSLPYGAFDSWQSWWCTRVIYSSQGAEEGSSEVLLVRKCTLDTRLTASLQ